MSRIWIIALFWFPAVCSGMMRVEVAAASVEELRERGMMIRVHSTSAPFRSVALEVEVPADTEQERFILMSLHVADRPLTRETVESVGISTQERRRVTDREGTFEVVGKDVDRAFLAIEFRCPDDQGVPHYRRYVLPIDEATKAEANKSVTQRRGADAPQRG